MKLSFFYKNFILVLMSACMMLSLVSCYNVSYPKENIHEAIKALVQKESGRTCEVTIDGTTVFLDMEMDGLTSADSKVVNDAVKSLQNAVFAITRIVLSTDAEIKIMVVSAFDPDYQVLLRMYQNIDDIKAYFYQMISRGDYEQRQLIEFEGPETAKQTVLDKHNITKEEYAARLVASGVNMLGRTDVFLSVLILSLAMRYGHIENGDIYFMTNGIKNNDSKKTITKIVSEQLNNILKKYKIFSIKSAILLDKQGEVIMKIPASLN